MRNKSMEYSNTFARNSFLLVFGIALLVMYVLPAQLKPSHFLQDDSYFYLQVAHNIVEGRGSTFHEITPTNGYHPLWMLFSILGLYLAGNDKILGLHFVLAIQSLLVMVILYYYYQIARMLHLRFWMVGLAILAVYFFSTGVYASEAYINATMLIVCLYYFVLSLDSDQVDNFTKSGLFAGFAILARLDNVFYISSIMFFFVFTDLGNRKKNILRRLAAFFLPVILLVLPYLAYNFFEYGHFMPISGAIKSTFPFAVGDLDNLGAVGKVAALCGFISLIFSFVLEITKPQRALLRVLAMGILLHTSYVILFTDHYTFWPWYYVGGILNIGFMFPIIAQWLVSRLSNHSVLKVATHMVHVFVIVLVVMGIARGWLKAYNVESIGSSNLPQINQYRWTDEVAVWMKSNLPSESAVFVHDWPGAIAYYSDLRILPMDGLMNDYQYNDDILEMEIVKYLCSKNVAYFFAPDDITIHEDKIYPIEAPLYRKPAGELRLLEQYKVVHTDNIVEKPDQTPQHAIWEIDQDCSR
jgi:hypothetical protein